MFGVVHDSEALLLIIGGGVQTQGDEGGGVGGSSCKGGVGESGCLGFFMIAKLYSGPLGSVYKRRVSGGGGGKG